jgi:acyl transferase domain-containing protein
MEVDEQQAGQVEGRLSEPVAIVGMDVILPGAGTLDDYWHNVVNGVDAISDVPPNRWEPEFYDPDRADQPNRLYCRRGGFVNDLAWFDPMAYGVMPASVPEIEPEQLVALRVSARAIDNAGGLDRLPNRDRVAVIFGRLGQSSMSSMRFYLQVMLSDQMAGYMKEVLPDITDEMLDKVRQKITDKLGAYHPENVIGLMPNLTASRVANRLNLRGPAYILDAACASSLLAVEHGIAGLLGGRLDAAVVGGVHLNHDVTFWAVFSQLRALSRTHQIRPFDRNADGLLIGEGCGAVVLKRLSDAVRDGDRIHAVIRGIGVSSDGRASSLVNPEPAGQLLAVRRAWASAGLDPTDPDAVGLLEAHGTGTPTGDAAELKTMAEAFGPANGHAAPVIGSVKSMIGHAMPAAGMASLVKTVLAMTNRTLPPTLHCADPRPELEKTRFQTIGKARPWDDSLPSRAAINAFGFGGVNVHVILEPPPQPAMSRRRAGASVAAAAVAELDKIVLLEAPDAAAMAKLLDASDDQVRAHGDTLATKPAGNGTAGCRLGIVDPTPERLAAARKIVAAGGAWRGGRDIWFSPRPMLAGGQGKIAYIFPGLEAELTHQVDDVAAHFGLDSPDVDEEDFSGRFMAVMGYGWLLNVALGHMGVKPEAVAGHSLGEWTAALVANTVAENSLATYAEMLFNPEWHRTDLQHAVVGCSAEQVEARLPGYPGVVVSIDNTPVQSVVCGPADQVSRLIEDLGRESVLCRPLPFTTGIHTPYVQPNIDKMRPKFEETLLPGERNQKLRSDVQYWSATTAALVPNELSERIDLFWRMLVEPVRFRPTLQAMYEAGYRVFLQVGPGQLASLIDDNLRGQDHLAIPVNVPFRGGLAQLQRVATALWVEGHAPSFEALSPPPPPEPAKPAKPKRSMPMQIDLGTPRFALGEGAGELIDVTVLAERWKARHAAALVPAGGQPGSGLLPGNAPAAPAGNGGATPAGNGGVRAAGNGSTAGNGSVAGNGRVAGNGTAVGTAGTGVAAGGTPGNGGQAQPWVPPKGSWESESVYKVPMRVSLATMPYLIDHAFNPQPANWPHVMDFNPVVAATTIIQHMVDAVEAAVPDMKVIQVDDARFRHWALAEPPVDVEVIVKRTGPGQFDAAFGAFASAAIKVAASYPPPPARWQQDPATEGPSPVSATDLYAKRIMFHGPQYQGVHKVHAVGKDVVRGLLRTPVPPGALLDSGLQLLGIWAEVNLTTNKVVFPTGFGRIQFFGPTPAAGDPVECTGRLHSLEERSLKGNIQYALPDGRVWAQITHLQTRRFDSHPRSRQAETEPGRYAFAVRQPEGWTVSFDYWPDPASMNSIVSLVLGIPGYADYEMHPVVTRKGWLLRRLAVKDAVRYHLWDAEPGRQVFPIEVTVSEDPDGRPVVASAWSELTLPGLDISAAQARHLAVALARPAGPGAAPVGIGVAEVGGHPKLTRPVVLTAAEQAVLDAAAAAEPGSDRGLWTARFGAAQEAAANALRIPAGAPAGTVAVTAATPTSITVTGAGRTVTLNHREIHTPPELVPRRYVVAWTPGR